MKKLWLQRSTNRESEPKDDDAKDEGDNNQQILFTRGDYMQTLETNPQNHDDEEESIAKHIIQGPLSPTEAMMRTTSNYNLSGLNREENSSKRFLNFPINQIHPVTNSHYANAPTTSGRQSTLPTIPTIREKINKGRIMPEFSFWAVVQIRKMIERLKTRYAYANLKSRHYALIDDASVDSRKKDHTKEKKRKYMDDSHTLKAKIRSCLKRVKCYHSTRRRSFALLGTIAERIPVFMPSNTFKLIWDFIKGLALLVMFFCLPLHIAVSEPISVIIGSTIMAFAMAIIFADVLVCLNTGYFSKGQIVANRHLIIVNYLSNSLISDITALIPLVIVISNQDSYSFGVSIFSLLFFVKFNDFSRVLKRIEDSFLLKPTTTNLVALLKLLFVILFVAHLCASVWIYEGTNSTQDNWYGSDKIDTSMWDPAWLDWYIKAYYFCTVTMVTVGYGDIYPASNPERLLSIGTMLLACCMYAYIVNSIGNIFSDFFRHSKEVKDNFYAINNYMEKKNISSSLKLKIKEYLSYYWDEERDNLTEKEQKIITQLSESLKRELKIEANKIVLSDTPVFHQNFSAILNEKICGIIQEHRCFPEQIVMKEDEEDDCNIYFIQKGKVEIFITRVSPEGVVSNKSCIVLEKGQYFGTFSFFTGLARQQSVRSMEFSQFLVIKRKDFIETIRSFDDDYQKFCMIKDQLMFNVSKGVENPCFTCNSSDHEFTTCPITHYAPVKNEIIKKYHFSSTHHRRTKITRTQSKFQTLKELEDTFKDGIKYLELNESYLLDQDWIQSFDEDSEDDTSSDSSNSYISEDKPDYTLDSPQLAAQRSPFQTYQRTPLQNLSIPPKSNPSQFLNQQRIRRNAIRQGNQNEINESEESHDRHSSQQQEDIILMSENLSEISSTSINKGKHETPPKKPIQAELKALDPIYSSEERSGGSNIVSQFRELLNKGKQNSGGMQGSLGINNSSKKNNTSNQQLQQQNLISIQDIQDIHPRNDHNANNGGGLKHSTSIGNFDLKGLTKIESKQTFFFGEMEIKETTSEPGDTLSIGAEHKQFEGKILTRNKSIDQSFELFPYFINNHIVTNQSDKQNTSNKDSNSQVLSNINDISLAQWNPLEKRSKNKFMLSVEKTEQTPDLFCLDAESPKFAQGFKTSERLNKPGMFSESDSNNFGSVGKFLMKDSQEFSTTEEKKNPTDTQNLHDQKESESTQQTGYFGRSGRISFGKTRASARHLSLNVANVPEKPISSPLDLRFSRPKTIINVSDKRLPSKSNSNQSIEKKSIQGGGSSLKSMMSLNIVPGKLQDEGKWTNGDFNQAASSASQEKLSKKERFWRKIEKNGQKISSLEIRSPLIQRAKLKLNEMAPNRAIPLGGHHSRQSSHQKATQEPFPQIGLQNYGLIYQKSGSSCSVSPNSRVKKTSKNGGLNSPRNANPVSRPVPRKSIMGKELQAFFPSDSNQYSEKNQNKALNYDQLKGLFSEILARFEENGRLAQPYPSPQLPNQKGSRFSMVHQDHPVGGEGDHQRNTLTQSGHQHHHHHHHTHHLPQNFYGDDEEQNPDLKNHSEVLLDTCQHFNTFYPYHNISHVMNLLNKNAVEKLKIMKKIKIKKTKANLLNTITEAAIAGKGNFGEKFKRKLISQKFLRNGGAKAKMNPINIPSEEENYSERSPTSSINSRRVQQSPHRVNFSSAVRRALKMKKNKLSSSIYSKNSFSTEGNNMQQQQQQLQPPSQPMFSKFKN